MDINLGYGDDITNIDISYGNTTLSGTSTIDISYGNTTLSSTSTTDDLELAISNAKTYADNAEQDAISAATSETNSATSALAAEVSYQNTVTIYGSTIDVQTAVDGATTSALSASTSATNAETSATTSSNSATASANSATTAQIQAWIAEAKQKTADSYATEAEDVLVKTYTSNGNGTFTATDTAEYSSLHHKAKATAQAAIATTQASNSASSASSASGSATTATTQAGNASTSATNASTSAGTATTKAGESATSATNSQLQKWEAEAAKMTADSYATEAEDVLVKTYTSDGDGTFTATNTTEYSALHHATKALASDTVKLIGSQTVGGIKTFTDIPAFNGGITGTSAPFTVDSTTVVTGLNADLLDGQNANAFATTDLLNTVNLTRADKYLASQNIANMVYISGNLSKIQYNNSTDVDYETLGYTLGNLTTISHYIGSTLKGTTTLSYTDGALTSAVFIGV